MCRELPAFKHIDSLMRRSYIPAGVGQLAIDTALCGPL